MFLGARNRQTLLKAWTQNGQGVASATPIKVSLGSAPMWCGMNNKRKPAWRPIFGESYHSALDDS